jgi:hypothetical protein
MWLGRSLNTSYDPYMPLLLSPLTINQICCTACMLCFISQSLSAVHVEQHLEVWMFIIWLNLQNPDGLPCPVVYLYISKKIIAADTTLCNLLLLLYAPKEHFLLLTYSTFVNVYRTRVSGYHAGYAAPGDRPIYGKSSFSLVEQKSC